MKQWTNRVKQLVRPVLMRICKPGATAHTCPICAYEGPFKDKRISKDPDLVRIESKCPACGSNERHRMLWLVFEEVFKAGPRGQVLHIAPEDCLAPALRRCFDRYHTADLFKPGVDFKEDIQKMSFADGTYDAVIVSRVLTIPPDIEASLREVRRVLRKGGVAIIAEIYGHEKTVEFGKMVNVRSRQIGVDMIDAYRRHFSEVELYYSDRYKPDYQLHNLMRLNGAPKDDYPAAVRIPGQGFKDLVAVCRA